MNLLNVNSCFLLNNIDGLPLLTLQKNVDYLHVEVNDAWLELLVVLPPRYSLKSVRIVVKKLRLFYC